VKNNGRTSTNSQGSRRSPGHIRKLGILDGLPERNTAPKDIRPGQEWEGENPHPEGGAGKMAYGREEVTVLKTTFRKEVLTMTEEEEIQDELLELQIYRDGLDYEWSKKPILVKAAYRIKSFFRDIIWAIKDKFFPEEEPPF